MQTVHSGSSRWGEIISSRKGKVVVWKDFVRKVPFDLGLEEQGVSPRVSSRRAAFKASSRSKGTEVGMCNVCGDSGVSLVWGSLPVSAGKQKVLEKGLGPEHGGCSQAPVMFISTS